MNISLWCSLWTPHLKLRWFQHGFPTWLCLRSQCSSCCQDDAAWPVCDSSAPVHQYEFPGCLSACTAPSLLPRSPWKYVPSASEEVISQPSSVSTVQSVYVCGCVYITLLTTNRLGIVSPLAHTTSPPSFTASGKICWTSWAITPAGALTSAGVKKEQQNCRCTQDTHWLQIWWTYENIKMITWTTVYKKWHVGTNLNRGYSWSCYQSLQCSQCPLWQQTQACTDTGPASSEKSVLNCLWCRPTCRQNDNDVHAAGMKTQCKWQYFWAAQLLTCAERVRDVTHDDMPKTRNDTLTL